MNVDPDEEMPDGAILGMNWSVEVLRRPPSHSLLTHKLV